MSFQPALGSPSLHPGPHPLSIPVSPAWSSTRSHRRSDFEEEGLAQGLWCRQPCLGLSGERGSPGGGVSLRAMGPEAALGGPGARAPIGPLLGGSQSGPWDRVHNRSSQDLLTGQNRFGDGHRIPRHTGLGSQAWLSHFWAKDLFFSVSSSGKVKIQEPTLQGLW